MDKFIGDTGEYDILGVKNGFRKLSELYIKQLVNDGKWFTVCHKIDKNQVDIMGIENSEGDTLGRVVDRVFEEGGYRTSIYKYLLMNFLCYIEVPTLSFKGDDGTRRNTFDKMLITSNVDVIASWLGVSKSDLPDKYKSRVWGIGVDDGEEELPYVKLTESKEGKRKVTCPRKNIDVSKKGTRVIPLFMLKAGVDTLYDKLKEDIIKVTFLKDGGQFRDMFTTVNFSKIKEIYGPGNFYDDSVMTAYDGDFIGNKTMSRGYIRVPEIGGSRYGTPGRSINYARIVNIDYTAEPDLSFIDIDLSTVVEGFSDAVTDHMEEAEDIIEMLEAFGIDGGCWSKNEEGVIKYPVRNTQTLLEWVEERNMLFTTVFQRDLCLFMLANPKWFSSFTGKPKYTIDSTRDDVGLA